MNNKTKYELLQESMNILQRVLPEKEYK